MPSRSLPGDNTWWIPSTRSGDFYLATSGDLDLATSGDFLMAMDTTPPATALSASSNRSPLDIGLLKRDVPSIVWTEGGLVPKQLRVDEPKPATNSLQVRLVAYGYSALTAGRYPAAISTITGTGLVPPTFA